MLFPDLPTQELPGACINGTFAYDVGVKVGRVAFLGVEDHPITVVVYPGKNNVPFSYDGTSKVLHYKLICR